MQTILVKGYIARVYRDVNYRSESLKKITEALSQYEDQIAKATDKEYLIWRPEYISMYTTKGLLQIDQVLKYPNEEILIYQSDLNEAKNTIQKALQLQQNAPYNLILQQVDLQCTLGRVYCKLQDYQNATQKFMEAHKRISKINIHHPLRASVQANWSRVYYETNELQKAIKKLENAWKLRTNYMQSEWHPNSLTYSYYLGEYNEEIGNIEKALKWYNYTIDGFDCLIGREDLRIRNLKKPHIILQGEKLPVYDTWCEMRQKCMEKQCYLTS